MGLFERYLSVWVGLAIIVVYFRNSGTIRVEEIDKLKG